MSTSHSTRETKANHNQPKTRRLQLESLEDRRLMIATHMVIDFSPDYRSGTFWDTFANTTYSNGTRPSFLDFNGDRQITATDAQIAAGRIRDAVSTFYSAPARGYNVGVTYSDATSQSYYGANMLNNGLRSNLNQVLVMYVGGKNTGEIGQAPCAPDGYTVEGYGQTYSQEIAKMLMGRSGMTPSHFVWSVAGTIAHEFGHMFGLRHSRNVYSNDIMNPAQSLTPWKDVFSTVTQNTQNGGPQNAFRELQNSFYGQPNVNWNYNGGSRLMPTGADLSGELDHDAADHADHEHEAGESCDFDLSAFLDSIAGKAAEVVHADRPIASDAGLESVLAKGVAQPAATQNDELSSSLRSKPNATSQRVSAGDLLTLLATDLQAKSQKSASATATSKAAASVNQLDDLFTELGFLKAK